MSSSFHQTPVRRPDRQYGGLLDDDDGSIWTATRCQRMLRSLTSRIATIRKKHEHYQARERGLIVTTDNALNTLSSRAVIEPAQTQARAIEEEEDPEWAPGRPAKRARHTYSNKSGSGLQRDTRRRNRGYGGNEAPKYGLTVSTPRISTSRVLRAIRTPRSERRGSLEKASPLASRKQSRRPFYTSRTNSDILRGVEHIWDGIKSSLDTLLVATAAISETSSQERRGSRPLFATCLSKVPRYIIASQAYLDEEAGGDAADMAEEVYSDLEYLSQNPKAGWRPLREVVRAHGIAILADAIREALIPLPRAVEWAFDCARKGCINEGDRLLEALTDLQIDQPEHLNLHDESFESVVRALQQYGASFGRNHLLWRLLHDAFLSGRMSWTWLAHPRREELWNSAIETMFQPRTLESSQSIDAVLKLVFTCGLGAIDTDWSELVHGLRIESNKRRSSRLSKPLKLESNSLSANCLSLTPMPFMFMSFMEVLATVIIMRPLPDSAAICAVRRILSHTCVLEQVTASSSKSEYQNCIGLMILLVKIAIACLESVDFGVLPDSCSWEVASRGVKITDEMYDILARCLTCVAENLGAAHSKDPKTFLIKMARHLLGLARDGGRKDLARIAVHTAFDFAERHPKKSNLDMALEIEEEAEDLEIHARELRATATPRRGAAQPTFRWEESICEWVAKTPLPKNKLAICAVHDDQKETRIPADDDDDGDDSKSTRNDSDSAETDQSNISNNESDAESGSGSSWSSHVDDQCHSATDVSMNTSPHEADRTTSSRIIRGSGRRHLQPQIMVPEVSKALKRCVSEPVLAPAPAPKRSKRTRFSNESATSFYRRNGQKVSGMRTSSRNAGRVSYVNDDESEDELGM